MFVYARPEHTQKTLDALAKNRLADKSELLVYSDAPKSERERQAVETVRQMVRSAKGFGKVTIIERESNFGLAGNIIGGVTDVCSTYGRAIVVEDDLITSPHFLAYMNEALDAYESVERVMHISGYSFPTSDFQAPGDTFFLRLPSCWGWATWQRAWQFFEKSDSVMGKFDKPSAHAFNIDGTDFYWHQLALNKLGHIDTWFVFWYAQVFLRNGLSLYPTRSLVRNIGHDGSGVYCADTGCFDVKLADKAIHLELLEAIQESEEAFEAHKKLFSSISPEAYRLMVQKLKKRQ